MKLKTVVMSKSGKSPIKFKKGALPGTYAPPAKKRAVIGFKGALAVKGYK